MESWFASLQQACRLEAERGFGDLMGRHETFSSFVARNLEAPPSDLTPDAMRSLAPLAAAFSRYRLEDLARRQHLLRQLRQGLHQVRVQSRPALPQAPPRLRLLNSPDGPESGSTPPALGSGSSLPPSSPYASATPSGSSGPADRASRSLLASTPLAEVPGIGPRTATQLAGLGLLVLGDLIAHYPRDYLDYANLVRIVALVPGRTATVVATVRRCHAFSSPRNPNLSILELHLQDSTGRLRVSRFFAGRRFSSPGWLKAQQRQFPPGTTVAVSGLVKESPYGPSFSDPLLEVLESSGSPVRSPLIGRLVPVYGLTEGLRADTLRRAIQAVLPHLERWSDPLPDALRQRLALVPRQRALRGIHQPTDQADLQASRRRLVFDEFLLLQLGLAQRRQKLRQRPALALDPPPGGADLVGQLRTILPFPLTGAQDRVLAEIRHDLARPQPMARLLQGDVGSGKTVVAVAALLCAIEAGCQGALMAPTEVLAEQHLAKLAHWLPQLHVSCALLTGSTPARRRRELLQDLINGQLQILVGTHALLEDPVQFARLGLVVVDEQHRFGVRQRNRLMAKGLQPHLLTMTATPIPRTLALSIHGDLDVSQIDELPPGRTPIRTRLLRSGERQEAWELVREQVALGQRAYVVLPLVEESEKLDLRSAVEVHRHLAEEVFVDLRVGLLHGRLSSEAKQAAIGAFARGECHVLVSTTVVEVGVDVPEASVMVIEHAERFGLAQLHQLRGRVGRGAAASHCLLLHGGNNADARQRLEVLVRSSDGFEIAEMDLRLRGPGQVLGTRQSGLPDLALASLTDDGDLLEQARAVAQELVAADPDLEAHPGLSQALLDQRQRQLEAARLN
ncbi:MAG: ATP-dependent DNA helicase RecG [Cyanobacteria bacterium]|nr:ATP-dependent DNA helicase RecG [Cyanobacteriota bacterium]